MVLQEKIWTKTVRTLKVVNIYIKKGSLLIVKITLSKWKIKVLLLVIVHVLKYITWIDSHASLNLFLQYNVIILYVYFYLSNEGFYFSLDNKCMIITFAACVLLFFFLLYHPALINFWLNQWEEVCTFFNIHKTNVTSQ